MRDFLFDTDNILAVTQADAEHIGQRIHQPHNVVRFVVAGHPTDGVECVI